MAEAAIDRAIKRELDKRGAWAFKTHGTTAGRRGIPDWSIVYRGRPIAVETKQPDGQITKLQHHELERARRAGAIAFVARSVDDLRKVLDSIDTVADLAA